MAFARHGQHKNNDTTPEGYQELTSAARNLAQELEGEDLRVVIVISPQQRAIQAAAVYAITLLEHGVTIMSRGREPRLDTAAGIAELCTGNHICGAPKYGNGFCAWWQTQGNDLSNGVEPFANVANRGHIAFTTHTVDLDDNTVFLYVGHGGVIEPMVHAITSKLIDDLTSAALVRVYDGLPSVYDPNK